MNGKLVGHKVLVKPDSLEQVSAGGIVIARPERDEKMEKAAVTTGVVLQVGTTAYNMDHMGGVPWCEVGDRVVYAKYEGKTIIDPETKEALLVINDEDVLFVFDKESK